MCLRTYVIMTCPVAPQVLAEGPSNVMHGSVRLNNVACAGCILLALHPLFLLHLLLLLLFLLLLLLLLPLSLSLPRLFFTRKHAHTHGRTHLSHTVSTPVSWRLTSSSSIDVRYLSKKGKNRHNWKSRWFLFDLRHRRVVYFEDQVRGLSS